MIGAALLCPLPIASFIASIRIISQCMHTFNLANGKAVLQHTFLNDILFLFFILVMKSLSIFQLTRLNNKCTSSTDRSFLRAKASHYQKLKSNLSQWCSAQTMHSSHNRFFTNRWAWVKMTFVSMQSNSSYESTNTWIFLQDASVTAEIIQHHTHSHFSYATTAKREQPWITKCIPECREILFLSFRVKSL